MAPEVLSGCYTDKCDMWSMGVVVYSLLSGRFPFYGATKQQTVEQIMTCRYQFPSDRWAHISGQAQNFIEKLLVSNPADRMSAAECLRHPWMQDMCGEPSDMHLPTIPDSLPVLLKAAVRTRSAMQDQPAMFATKH